MLFSSYKLNSLSEKLYKSSTFRLLTFCSWMRGWWEFSQCPALPRCLLPSTLCQRGSESEWNQPPQESPPCYKEVLHPHSPGTGTQALESTCQCGMYAWQLQHTWVTQDSIKPVWPDNPMRMDFILCSNLFWQQMLSLWIYCNHLHHVR